MSTDQNQTTLALPARLDRSAAVALQATFDAHTGKNLVVNGAELETIGGLGLQLLHVARNQWSQAGWGFEIVEPSATLSEALGWLENEHQEHIGDFA